MQVLSPLWAERGVLQCLHVSRLNHPARLKNFVRLSLHVTQPKCESYSRKYSSEKPNYTSILRKETYVIYKPCRAHGGRRTRNRRAALLSIAIFGCHKLLVLPLRKVGREL